MFDAATNLQIDAALSRLVADAPVERPSESEQSPESDSIDSKPGITIASMRGAATAPRRQRKRHNDGDDEDDKPAPIEELEVCIDEAKLELLSETPKAFIEPPNPTYNRDAIDDLQLPPSFITDYINTSRGMEAPTSFMLWGAVWTLSTALARHAWIKWYPKALWPNMYILLVAPPGLCKKSTSFDVGQDLIPQALDLLPSNIDRFKKQPVFVTGKATSDGILSALAPETRIFLDSKEGAMGPRTVNRGSKAAFIINELTQLLNRQQYNVNLVTTLTNLYDCKDEDAELTRARGMEPLRHIYTTFIAATTPDNMRTSLPTEALGGGFISRVVTVYQDVPTKVYPIPMAFADYPQPADLVQKLAWIMHHARGEYELTREALELYSSEYYEWKRRISDRAASETSGETRFDVLLLKLAMLFRVAEYRSGNDITEQNVKAALNVLNATLAGASPVTEDLGMNEYTRWMNQLKRMIERTGSVQRYRAQRALSAKGCNVVNFDLILDQLAAEGRIVIMLGGSKLNRTQRSGDEIYELTPAELKRLATDRAKNPRKTQRKDDTRHED